MFLSLLMSLGPCHYTRPVFMLTDRVCFSNSIRKILLPSQLLLLGEPVLLATVPRSLSSLPQWPSLSEREKTQRMFFPSQAEDPWARLAQNKLYMGLWWQRQTQNYPVGFGFEEFRKSPRRYKRASLQREADIPGQWSGECQEGEKYLGSPQPSCFIWRISLKWTHCLRGSQWVTVPHLVGSLTNPSQHLLAKWPRAQQGSSLRSCHIHRPLKECHGVNCAPRDGIWEDNSTQVQTLSSHTKNHTAVSVLPSSSLLHPPPHSPFTKHKVHSVTVLFQVLHCSPRVTELTLHLHLWDRNSPVCTWSCSFNPQNNKVGPTTFILQLWGLGHKKIK